MWNEIKQVWNEGVRASCARKFYKPFAWLCLAESAFFGAFLFIAQDGQVEMGAWAAGTLLSAIILFKFDEIARRPE